MAEHPGSASRTGLPPEPASVSAARRFATETLRAWRLPAVAADVTLVVSELATNAVLHARTPFDVTLRRSGAGVRVEVVDGSSSPVSPLAPVRPEVPPSLMGADDDPAAIEDLLRAGATTGRGLQMVAGVARSWGSVPRPEGPGKVVWAELGTGDRPTGAGPADADGPGGVGLIGHPVRLVAVPVRLALASDLDLETLLREVQVMALTGDAPDHPLALVAAANEILDLFTAARHAAQDAVRTALERGDRLVDVDLLVPVTAGAMLRRLGEVLEGLAAYCERGDLLALAPTDELRRYRSWCTEEVTRQVAGARPRPCPFSALPRPGPAPTPEVGAAALAELGRFRRDMDTAWDVRGVVQVLLSELVGPIGGTSAMLCLVDGSSDRIDVVDSMGMPEAVTQHWQDFGLGDDLPGSEAVRTGRPVVLRTRSERDLLYPAFRSAPVIDDATVACVPIPGEGAPVGAVVVSFALSRELGPADLRLLGELAAVTGAALARVGEDRGRRERARRGRIVGGLATELADRPELEGRLEAAVEALCGYFSSWTSAYLVDPGGAVRPLGGRHPDPLVQEDLRHLERSWPPTEPSDAVVRCLSSGETVVFQSVPVDLLRSLARDRDHLDRLQAVDIGAVVAAPVRLGGRPVAALAASTARGRWLTDTDVRLVEDVCRLVGDEPTPA